MSFQWIIDNAESIEFETRPVVAQTQSRSGLIRTVSRGGAVWQFSVRLPDGPRWQDYRQRIAEAEGLGRTTAAAINFADPGLSWMFRYQGSAPDPAGITVSVPASGNTVSITSGGAVSGHTFRAGDVIQLGTTGRVYRVVEDVPAGTTTVTLHRPLLDPPGTVTLVVGSAVEFQVICVDFPRSSAFARDQLAWSGSFVFVEVDQ